MFRFVYLILSLLLPCSAAAGVTEWIDIELESGHIKIPVKVAGIDTYAILDTGAQRNGLNQAFITKHGLSFPKGGKVRVKGVYGKEKRSSLNNVPVNLFGVDMSLDGLVGLSLGYHTNGLLLGAGFFENFITQIDYPNSRMRLLTRDALEMKRLNNIKLRKQKGSGQPIVKVTLNGEKSAWLLLDTGNAGGILLKRNVAQQNGWLEDHEVTSRTSSGANTTGVLDSFRLPELEFGPFTLSNVEVSVPAEGETANLVTQYSETGTHIKGKKVQGLLGYDVLKHFVLTIDYRKGYAHIGVPEGS